MLFFINFKAYEESTGAAATELVRKIESNFNDLSLIKIVLNPLDSMITTRIEKYIQRGDPVNSGPYTGHIPIDLLRNYGYRGIMLNHSECRLEFPVIRDSINVARRNGLITLACASDINELRTLIPLNPDYLAYEPPELIGGDVSVSTEKPGIIEKAAKLLEGSDTKLIVGAGVKNREDVEVSERLGASGVLVSSGVVKSLNPIKSLEIMMNKGD